MDRQQSEYPKWAAAGPTGNENLKELLAFASENWSRHIDLFFRHQEAGTKHLAAVLATETALVGISFSRVNIPGEFFAVLLVMLSVVVTPVVAFLAISACRRSFQAALESIYMVGKVIWAMGLTSRVAVDRELVNAHEGPGVRDLTLYGPRWSKDCLSHKSSEEFVNANFSSRRNTFFMMKVTVVTLGLGAFALGLVGAYMVAFKR